ncbi:MAG: LapA family protein [bacterium]
MQFFFWLVFLVALSVTILVIQNLNAPVVAIKCLFWKFETSLTDTMLGSIGCGMLIVLLLWFPRGIKNLFRVRNLRKRVEILEEEVKHTEGSKPKEP